MRLQRSYLERRRPSQVYAHRLVTAKEEFEAGWTSGRQHWNESIARERERGNTGIPDVLATLDEVPANPY